MTATPSTSPAGAVVIDTSTVVAVVAREITEPKAGAEIVRYGGMGYEFFAPGALVAETFYRHGRRRCQVVKVQRKDGG